MIFDLLAHVCFRHGHVCRFLVRLSCMSSLPIRHDEAKKTFQSKLGEIVEEDPYLGDLPKDVTLDEAKGFVALSSGQALAVTLVKYDGEEIRKCK